MAPFAPTTKPLLITVKNVPAVISTSISSFLIRSAEDISNANSEGPVAGCSFGSGLFSSTLCRSRVLGDGEGGSQDDHDDDGLGVPRTTGAPWLWYGTGLVLVGALAVPDGPFGVVGSGTMGLVNL